MEELDFNNLHVEPPAERHQTDEAAEEAPTGQLVDTLGLWAHFEQIPEATRSDLFSPLIHALHYSSSLGLSVEQLKERAAALAEVQDDIARQIERVSRPEVPRIDLDY